VSKYFDIQPGVLVYEGQTTKSKTTPTTIPSNPRVDGVQVDTWNHFGEEVREFMARRGSTVPADPNEVSEYTFAERKVANMMLTYDSEKTVEYCFSVICTCG
jgi:hypothetical protein